MKTNGEKNAQIILSRVLDIIQSSDILRVDYANIVDPHTLENVDFLDKTALLAIAIFAGSTRLIDNRMLI